MQKIPSSLKIKYLLLDIFRENVERESWSVKARVPTSQDTSTVWYFIIDVALIPLHYLRQFKPPQVWALTITILCHKLQSSHLLGKMLLPDKEKPTLYPAWIWRMDDFYSHSRCSTSMPCAAMKIKASSLNLSSLLVTTIESKNKQNWFQLTALY